MTNVISIISCTCPCLLVVPSALIVSLGYKSFLVVNLFCSTNLASMLECVQLGSTSASTAILSKELTVSMVAFTSKNC
jgi:hypothetical protein